MTSIDADQIAALYDAAEASGDVALCIALLRGLSDPVFAGQARALLRASPGARAAVVATLRAERGAPANG